MIEEWIVDRGPVGADNNDSLVLIIGTDTNGNGKLDPGEPTTIIAQCKYVPGDNVKSSKIDGNGHLIITVMNVHDKNKNQKIDRGEEVTTYTYDVDANVLTITNEKGEVLFKGNPADYHGWLPVM